MAQRKTRLFVNRHLRQVLANLSNKSEGRKQKIHPNIRKIILFIRSHIRLILSEGIKQSELPSFDLLSHYCSPTPNGVYVCVCVGRACAIYMRIKEHAMAGVRKNFQKANWMFRFPELRLDFKWFLRWTHCERSNQIQFQNVPRNPLHSLFSPLYSFSFSLFPFSFAQWIFITLPFAHLCRHFPICLVLLYTRRMPTV